MKKLLLTAGPVVLGLPILLWVLETRRESDAGPANPPKRAPRAQAAPAPSAEPDDRISGATAPVRSARPASTEPVSPETAAILERVRKMEERARELETRRDELSRDNRELEKQITEKWAEASAKSVAEWRVRGWEALLGLNENQKQALLELCTQWAREDAGRPVSRETWQSREPDLRPRLTAEQAVKLQETGASQAQKLWSRMGLTLGSAIGASKEEQVRLQQTIGDFRAPGDMLLPEAHGADWPGLMHEAVGRVKPSLTAEQTARLDKMGWK